MQDSFGASLMKEINMQQTPAILGFPSTLSPGMKVGAEIRVAAYQGPHKVGRRSDPPNGRCHKASLSSSQPSTTPVASLGIRSAGTTSVPSTFFQNRVGSPRSPLFDLRTTESI